MGWGLIGPEIKEKKEKRKNRNIKNIEKAQFLLLDAVKALGNFQPGLTWVEHLAVEKLHAEACALYDNIDNLRKAMKKDRKETKS